MANFLISLLALSVRSGLVKKIARLHGRLFTDGCACTSDELKNHVENKTDTQIAWKGDHPGFINVSNSSVGQVLDDLHGASDLVLTEVVALAADYKVKQ